MDSPPDNADSPVIPVSNIVINRHLEHWRSELTLIYADASYTSTLSEYSDTCSRGTTAPTAIVEVHSSSYGKIFGCNRCKQYKLLINKVEQPSHGRRRILGDVSNQSNNNTNPSLSNTALNNVQPSSRQQSNTVNTNSNNNTVSSDELKPAPHAVCNLDSRFQYFVDVYPSVLYNNTDRYYWTGHTLHGDGRRKFMCAYPNCEQGPQTSIERVHRYSNLHAVKDQRLFNCRYCDLNLESITDLKIHYQGEHSNVHKQQLNQVIME